MKKRLVAISMLFFITSCEPIPYTHLGNDYVFSSNNVSLSMIFNTGNDYINRIYPKVVDYRSNESYIIAKQIANKDAIISILASDISQRFNDYNYYMKNPEKFDSTFQGKRKRFIIADSLNYYYFLKFKEAAKQYSDSEAAHIIAGDIVDRKGTAFNKMIENKVSYWVLDLHNDSLMGPLNAEDFRKWVDGNPIPESLKLP